MPSSDSSLLNLFQAAADAESFSENLPTFLPSTLGKRTQTDKTDPASRNDEDLARNALELKSSKDHLTDVCLVLSQSTRTSSPLKRRLSQRKDFVMSSRASSIDLLRYVRELSNRVTMGLQL